MCTSAVCGISTADNNASTLQHVNRRDYTTAYLTVAESTDSAAQFQYMPYTGTINDGELCTKVLKTLDDDAFADSMRPILRKICTLLSKLNDVQVLIGPAMAAAQYSQNLC